jgi:hypothetical protein
MPPSKIYNVTDSHHLHLNDVSTVSMVSSAVPTAVPSAVEPLSPGVPLANEQKWQIGLPGQAKKGREKIWSTGTTEKRDFIEDFWHGLSEEERGNLVNVLYQLEQYANYQQRYASSGGTIPPPQV